MKRQLIQSLPFFKQLYMYPYSTLLGKWHFVARRKQGMVSMSIIMAPFDFPMNCLKHLWEMKSSWDISSQLWSFPISYDYFQSICLGGYDINHWSETVSDYIFVLYRLKLTLAKSAGIIQYLLAPSFVNKQQITTHPWS